MSALFNLFYLYDPWIAHFFRMAFFVGIISFVILGIKYVKKELRQGITIPFDSIVVIFSLLILSFIPMLVHQTQEFGVIKMYCKTLILFLFGIGLFNLYYTQENAQQKLVNDLKIGIVIQSVVGFLALLGIPFVVDALLNTNAMMPRFFGSEQEYRLYNITSSAFFHLSLFFVFLLHFLLAYNEKHNTIHSVFIFLILFIGLISGRTFLLICAFSILLYFKWRYIPALILFSIIVLLLAIYLPDNRYVAHALEPIINIIAIVKKFIYPTENLEVNQLHITQLTSSTDNLVKNHLYLPQLEQILIGDGLYFNSNGGYYGGSDSGFIRQTLYGGVSYMAVCFLFMVYFVRRVAQNWFNGSKKFIFSTLFILSICNIKDNTYAVPGIMLVLLMFLSLFGKNGKNITLFKQDKNKADK